MFHPSSQTPLRTGFCWNCRPELSFRAPLTHLFCFLWRAHSQNTRTVAEGPRLQKGIQPALHTHTHPHKHTPHLLNTHAPPPQAEGPQLPPQGSVPKPTHTHTHTSTHTHTHAHTHKHKHTHAPPRRREGPSFLCARATLLVKSAPPHAAGPDRRGSGTHRRCR
jgi:hypothetical protein